MDVLLNLPQRHGRLHGGNGHADDIAPGLLQPVNLLDGGLHILGLRVAHGLDEHRISAADLTVSDLNDFRVVPYQCLTSSYDKNRLLISLNSINTISVMRSAMPVRCTMPSLLRVHRLSAQRLDEKEHQPSAVQCRNRKQIHHA